MYTIQNPFDRQGKSLLDSKIPYPSSSSNQSGSLQYPLQPRRLHYGQEYPRG